MHQKIQLLCCVGFINTAISIELYDFIRTLYETSIIITKPLLSSTFQWAMQLSKQCLWCLGSLQVLVYSLPAEHTEVILLDFITVPCFMLHIQLLRKSEDGIISYICHLMMAGSFNLPPTPKQVLLFNVSFAGVCFIHGFF